MPTYLLYLESGPRKKRTLVHVPGLPGCAFAGPTTDEAVAGAPAGIRKYLEFLQDSGEDVDPEAPIETVVAGHETEGWQIGYMSPVIFFAADVPPLSRSDVGTIAGRLRAMRTAQLALVDDLSSADLLAGPGRPLQAVLSHQLVGGDDWCFASAFGKEDELRKTFRLTEKGVLDPRAGMRQSLSLVLDRLESLSDGDLAADVYRGRVRWTARKGLRYLLEWNWILLNEISSRLGRPIVP